MGEGLRSLEEVSLEELESIVNKDCSKDRNKETSSDSILIKDKETVDVISEFLEVFYQIYNYKFDKVIDSEMKKGANRKDLAKHIGNEDTRFLESYKPLRAKHQSIDGFYFSSSTLSPLKKESKLMAALKRFQLNGSTDETLQLLLLKLAAEFDDYICSDTGGLRSAGIKKSFEGFYETLDTWTNSVYKTKIESAKKENTDLGSVLDKEGYVLLYGLGYELVKFLEKSIEQRTKRKKDSETQYLNALQKTAEEIRTRLNISSVQAVTGETTKRNWDTNIAACIYKGQKREKESLVHELDDGIIKINFRPEKASGNYPSAQTILMEAENKEGKKYIVLEGLLSNEQFDNISPANKDSIYEFVFDKILRTIKTRYFDKGEKVDLIINTKQCTTAKERGTHEFLRYAAKRLGKQYSYELDNERGWLISKTNRTQKRIWLRRNLTKLEERLKEQNISFEGVYNHSWSNLTPKTFINNCEGEVIGYEIPSNKLEEILEVEKINPPKKSIANFVKALPKWMGAISAAVVASLVVIGVYVDETGYREKSQQKIEYFQKKAIMAEQLQTTDYLNDWVKERESLKPVPNVVEADIDKTTNPSPILKEEGLKQKIGLVQLKRKVIQTYEGVKKAREIISASKGDIASLLRTYAIPSTKLDLKVQEYQDPGNYTEEWVSLLLTILRIECDQVIKDRFIYKCYDLTEKRESIERFQFKISDIYSLVDKSTHQKKFERSMINENESMDLILTDDTILHLEFRTKIGYRGFLNLMILRPNKYRPEGKKSDFEKIFDRYDGLCNIIVGNYFGEGSECVTRFIEDEGENHKGYYVTIKTPYDSIDLKDYERIMDSGVSEAIYEEKAYWDSRVELRDKSGDKYTFQTPTIFFEKDIKEALFWSGLLSNMINLGISLNVDQ